MRILIAALFAISMAAFGQQSPATPKDKMVAEWTDVARKVNALAAEFPEAKYDYRPTPEVRTFAQQMLHLAFWNQFVAKSARGEKPDGKLNELPRSEYKTKAAVTGALQDSFTGLLAALKATSEEDIVKRINLWATFLEHSGEHYGQAALYYRLNGLIPPESRPK